MRGGRLRALKKTIALKVRCAAAESDTSEEVRSSDRSKHQG